MRKTFAHPWLSSKTWVCDVFCGFGFPQIIWQICLLLIPKQNVHWPSWSDVFPFGQKLWNCWNMQNLLNLRIDTTSYSHSVESLCLWRWSVSLEKCGVWSLNNEHVCSVMLGDIRLFCVTDLNNYHNIFAPLMVMMIITVSYILKKTVVVEVLKANNFG